jgi:hypothetical protein
MSTRQFYCDCPLRCKRRKLVSRTTYYDHAKFRPQLGLHSDYNTSAALHGVPASSSSNPISSNHELHGPVQSVEVSEDESDGEGSSSATRTPGLLVHARGQVDQAISGGRGSSDGPQLPEGDEGRLIHHGSGS